MRQRRLEGEGVDWDREAGKQPRKYCWEAGLLRHISENLCTLDVDGSCHLQVIMDCRRSYIVVTLVMFLTGGRWVGEACCCLNLETRPAC